MSRRLFVQIMALICFGGLVFVAAAQLQSWLAVRTYQARLIEIENDAKERARLSEIKEAIARNSVNALDADAADQAAVSRATPPSEHQDADDIGAPATGNDNMIDGQKVTLKGDVWVNTKGKTLGAADD